MYMGARACGRANGAHARNFAKKVSLERIDLDSREPRFTLSSSDFTYSLRSN